MSARRLFAVSTLLAAATTTASASAEIVQVGQIPHVCATAGKLRATKVDGKDAVEVFGAGTVVRVGYRAEKLLTSAKVGIRHVDRGAHGFEVAFGNASILDNTAPAATAKITCNGFGPATIDARFGGSATFSVVVTKGGKTVKSLTGQSGPVTIADFDTVHDGHVETLGVTFAHGLVKKGSWSMRLEHDDFVVTFTADAPRAALSAGELTMSARGLDAVTLVDHEMKVAAP